MATTTLDLDSIQTNGGTQARAEINQGAVKEYAERMKTGGTLPPVVVFGDGSTYWLSDGFHRYWAAKRNKSKQIRVEVKKGGLREAILYAVGANDQHGLRRTNADKRCAVEILLKDKEWVKRSDRWVGEKAKVSHEFVRSVRPQMSTVDTSNGTEDAGSDDSGTRTGQDGKQYPASGGSETNSDQTSDDTPAAPVLDKRKQPVEIEALHPIFEGAVAFDEISNTLASLKGKIKTLSEQPHGKLLLAHYNETKRDLDNASRTVKFGRPYTVCVYCKGGPKQETCEACNGHGWINEIAYKQAPESMKS